MIAGDKLIPRLVELFRRIDAAYAELAAQLGLSCEGCDGVACCTVDLTLHTFTEMLHLRRGFNTLELSRQLEVLGRCRSVIKAKQEDPFGKAYREAVCVLNFGGLCALYEYRPMICRLAAIPHFFRRPDGKTIESRGCARYQDRIAAQHAETRIDRTTFYRDMALLEMEVVWMLGKRIEPRTVAETLGLDHPEIDLP